MPHWWSYCVFSHELCDSVQVEYRKGHEERVSKYTAVTDTPEVLLAKAQSHMTSDVSPTSTHMHHYS